VGKMEGRQEKINKFKDKSFCVGRFEFAKAYRCLFFKNDSYLSNYLSKESVFSQNPKTKTNPFIENSNFSFGAWFDG
jgi:hypothetical protein